MEEKSNDIPKLNMGEVQKKTLHFFWLADCSGSMEGAKIASLNQAIDEALPEVEDELRKQPGVQMKMRAIKFSDEALWHVGPEAVGIDNFKWPELEASGLTTTAQAINLLASEMTTEKMGKHGIPPVCILVSDGFCTDSTKEYDNSIKALDELPWGMKAVRLAVAIGQDHEYDEKELLKFVSHKDTVGVLKARNPEQIVEYIKWASTIASMSSMSTPAASFDDDAVTDQNSNDNANVVLPAPPDFDDEDVF